MMYKKNVVAAIKVGGKVLREKGDVVQLPFGSEYSILLKNLNTVRVMAKVTIDGQEVTGDRWLVLGPNGSLELERFIKDGNLQRGNKLKFIERNEAVEEARGIQAEDGLIRIEWKTESVYTPPKIVETHHYHHDHYFPRPYWRRPYYGDITWTANASSNFCGTLNNGTGGLTRSLVSRSSGLMKSAQVPINQCSMQPSDIPNEAGITVPGSESQQQFTDTGWFATEPGSEVLVLKLAGRHGETVVERPVTVDLRPTCQTCKRKSKAGAQYCSSCGTSLKLI